ncbi:unnamed protein product [Miscanthus lutarioriparius]|uniref:PB1-like domain-containing protein n=1 Tax=Miscanthus lutarioriparius TaxID=422564 RepID=A0A811PLM4_9POAL|nr:unnamed protein product [Miscanthus lutarioriparius]
MAVASAASFPSPSFPGQVADCVTMAVDNWTINLECDGKAEGHKHVQREMDRDEICFFNLIDLIEGSGYTSVDYLYYKRTYSLVVIEQDFDVMEMLNESDMVITRKCTIQSNDEYMLEQDTRQESPQQNVAASKVHTSVGGDQIDSEDISEANRINCTKKSTHTAGTKSFARNREERKEKDPEKKYPHRVVLYIHTHKTKSEKDTNAHVDDLKKLIGQQPDLADTSQGKVAWRGDALNRVLGEEKPGHVHSLGLVPNPNQVFDLSTSKRLKNINMTSLYDKSSEDVVSLRLQMEKFGRQVQNQDATILELQQKTKISEQRHIQQECLDVPLQDGFSTDVPNLKRKVCVSMEH